jgi:modulator of FtsH protease HflK
MPWKEPGEKPRDPGREPWGTGGRGNGPDIDAWLRGMRRSLGPFGQGPLGVAALVAVLVVLWFAIGGWTLIDAGQVGVLTRFGRMQAVLQPGLHLHFPSPVDRVRALDVNRTRSVDDNVQLLTSDGQLALIGYRVQYKISDVRDYLFSVRNAEDTLRTAAVAALRSVVGAHTLQQMMDRAGDDMNDGIRKALQASLADVPDGMKITDVAIQSVDVPAEVKQAYDAIDKVQAGAATARETAESDVQHATLKTRARAASIKTDAEAYRRDVIAEANADVARFDRILPQYQAAPQVTMHSLWLQTMQAVLTRNHVIVNTGSGSVIVQFPVQHAPVSSGKTPAAAGSGAAVPVSSVAPVPASSVGTPATSASTIQETGA